MRAEGRGRAAHDMQRRITVRQGFCFRMDEKKKKSKCDTVLCRLSQPRNITGTTTASEWERCWVVGLRIAE